MSGDKLNDVTISIMIRSLEFRDDSRHRMTATGIAANALVAAGWPLTAQALLDAWILERDDWEQHRKTLETMP